MDASSPQFYVLFVFSLGPVFSRILAFLPYIEAIQLARMFKPYRRDEKERTRILPSFRDIVIRQFERRGYDKGGDLLDAVYHESCCIGGSFVLQCLLSTAEGPLVTWEDSDCDIFCSNMGSEGKCKDYRMRSDCITLDDACGEGGWMKCRHCHLHYHQTRLCHYFCRTVDQDTRKSLAIYYLARHLPRSLMEHPMRRSTAHYELGAYDPKNARSDVQVRIEWAAAKDFHFDLVGMTSQFTGDQELVAPGEWYRILRVEQRNCKDGEDTHSIDFHSSVLRGIPQDSFKRGLLYYILNRFDFDFCKVGYDGKYLMINTPQSVLMRACYVSIERRRIIDVSPLRSAPTDFHSDERISKYRKRGFSILPLYSSPVPTREQMEEFRKRKRDDF